MQKQPSS